MHISAPCTPLLQQHLSPELHTSLPTFPCILHLHSCTFALLSPYLSTTMALHPKQCTFCGMSGHLAGSCFRQHNASHQAREEVREKQIRGRGKPQDPEFAGNASSPDYTNPHSPLIPDAGVDWNTDTGATCHMTPHRHWFNTYKPHVVPIRLANNQIIHSAGIGSVLFKPTVNGKPGQLLEFHRVLHVPELRNNLLSVLYLTCHKSYVVSCHP